MTSLPLTSQGKIDRAALTLTNESLSSNEVDTSQEEASEEDNEIQSEVFDIVSNLLGIRNLRSHDNFFRLGGHSLLAAQLITRVRRAFGVELPIRSVFEAPTIASLSNAIEERLLIMFPEATSQSPAEGLAPHPARLVCP